jgi:hypothetical protein
MLVKRIVLIRKLTAAAAAAGIDLILVREGGSHSILRCGSRNAAIPRHREISELTALGVMKELEKELGKDWWN